ncbi:MAG: hypothetical protein Q4A78_08980 [Peptostreptococcaceae bacterium]|nr:hypothetical protein [Peptostreptococcaceae bacterium]
MKKSFLRILSITAILLLLSPSFSAADSKPQLKTYTLREIRKLALENAETLDAYKQLREKYRKQLLAEEGSLGDKYKVFNEQGKEITKYSSGRELSYDYPAKLESFEKIIDNLKKQNELQAIRKYHEIVGLEVEIEKKKNAIERAEMDLKVASKVFSAGYSIKLEEDLAKANLDTLRSEMQQQESSLRSLYLDMDRLTGIPKGSSYRLDTIELLRSSKIEGLGLSVPAEAADYVRKESQTIKDLQKKIKERKKELELFTKKIHTPKALNEKVKELDVEGLEKELQRTKDAIYFDLETDHLEILLSLLKISNMKEDMDFLTYEQSVEETKYKNGLLSKKIYLHHSDNLLDKKNDLLTAVLEMHQKILSYEIKTGKDRIE